MRNWITLIESFSTNEDLDFDSIEDHKIVLDDPANDEVDNLKKASPEKKAKILKDVERDMHESDESDDTPIA